MIDEITANETAPAPISLIKPIFLLKLGCMKSHIFSTVVFKASIDKIKPDKKVWIIHSFNDILKWKPRNTNKKITTNWICIEDSEKIKKNIPLNAVNILFNLIERYFITTIS